MNLAKWLALLAGVTVLSACQTPPQAPANQLVLPSAPSTNANTGSDGTVTQLPNITPFSTDTALTTGDLQHTDLSEVSGLAASTRRSNLLWAVNDSGNSAQLYALGPKGSTLGRFEIATRNRDWEDMASAWINGESYLLIADIGDNLRSKDEHAVHVLIEPLLENKEAEPLVPFHTIRFRYPNDAHDSESMAYADGWIYILTKESIENDTRQASDVYRVPVEFSNPNNLLVAEKIASLAIPRNTIEASLVASISGVDIFQPTAFDIDPQNCNAYVLTYRAVYRYQRPPEKSWAEVLAQPRNRIHTHSLSQAEALAVSDNGVVWFTSEKKPAPLWALPGVEPAGQCH